MPISPVGTKKNKRGFTIIELMVVLAIMVVLSGVAMVSIMPMLSEARLHAGCRIIMSACTYARSYAVAHNVETQVVFDQERMGVAVQRRDTEAEGSEPSWVQLTTQSGQFRRLPDGVTIDDLQLEETDDEDQAAVTFTPLGRTKDAVITLRDTHDRTRDVRLDAITGRCSVANTVDE